MASVLILAAAGAAVAALLALRLWVVLHPRVLVPRQSLSLLVVAGSGGHTTEILRLLENLSNAYSPRHYIIADTDEMSAHKINSFELNRADRDPSTMLPEYYIHRIPRSREVQQSWLSTVLTTLYSMWLSFPLTHRVKPDLDARGIPEGECQRCSPHRIQKGHSQAYEPPRKEVSPSPSGLLEPGEGTCRSIYSVPPLEEEI
ncbi:UDP-N-acetylglucosamine transferase subunit ALG14 homolog isoform X2 [Ursus americanus]|uniref:UDP-N-acetylglucosamine transferase subunit ALG14 homolog isoform X2 n=1 Tax=Ursus americanus TaxID=9643 RepID=UPI001E67B65F|nr:UDP-N-acetylglucosamine transferase subunit ALG14 homolog isoform X2 [Ursus americanus]